MNLLTERMPDSVYACGRIFPVDPDFRLMVELENAAVSADGLPAEVMWDLLQRFYRKEPPQDPEEAVEGMLWFYRCGKDDAGEGGASGKSRAYDFKQDAEALYTSFLQTYNIDLSSSEVHWWKFRRLMFGLPADTPFAQRLHYRTADTSGMGKEQKKHYGKMKRLYAIREQARCGETLAQRDERMLAYVNRRFSEVCRGKTREKD